MGGTEILAANLAKRVDLSGINLIVSTCHPLDPSKPNILWQHLNTDGGAVQELHNPEYVAGLQKIVFVSNWQMEKYIREFNLPREKCTVIRNAVEPIELHEKPQGRIRLIYTSTPWRGLDKLIEAYSRLNRDDVELVVYSGTKIYGQAFHEWSGDRYQPLYDALKTLPNCTHIDYATNAEVREALKSAHIMAYPNTWEETSCVSAIEALAAGCKVVTTRNGALPETCEDWADYATVEEFAEALNRAIDNYKYNQEQVAYYNANYGWDTRANEWRKLLEQYQGFVPKLQKLKENGIQIDRLIDIGAYQGKFTEAVKHVYGDIPVQQFEADERQKQFLLPTATIALLGDQNKEVDFYTIENGITTGSSIYRENTEYYKDPLILKKQMVKLDDVIDTSGDWTNTLIKIDVQGAELDVLRGAQRLLAEKEPKYILLECSIQQYNQGSPLVDVVIKQMGDWGYQPRAEFDLVHDQNGNPLQVDILFERRPKMRRVLIATPAYDGRLDVWYVDSLVNTIRIAQDAGIFVHPVYLSYDALIQRARNDLIRLAVEENYDDMIWIDSDIQWDPNWIMELLNREEDVVGGTYRKKTDDEEMYTVKTKDLTIHKNGLIKLEGIGTGFVKMSRKAFTALWDASPEYLNEGRISRMVCDVQIIDGHLVSEDNILFKKLIDLGFDIWLDPKMTCVHIGTKKFYGNFNNYREKLQKG